MVDGVEPDKIERLGPPIIDVSQAGADGTGEGSICRDGKQVLSISAATLLVVRPAAALPLRRSRRAVGEEIATLDARLLNTLGRAAPPNLPPVSALGLETALEAMAPAAKLAVAADLDCRLYWCAGEHRCPAPADPEDLVRYLRALEADGKKPATLTRRIASVATLHRLLDRGAGLPPTSAPMVRNALRANRRRKGVAQRQAAPLRFGGALGQTAGFTIAAMLEACSRDPQRVA